MGLRWGRRGGHQQAADFEGRVADEFSGEAEARAAGEEAVWPGRASSSGSGVAADDLVGMSTTVTILPTRRFHVPAALHEIDRQPVEQFGMAWVLALGAEVSGRCDEAGAEEHFPESVHGDARGERVSRIVIHLARPSRLAGAPSGSGGRAAGCRR